MQKAALSTADEVAPQKSRAQVEKELGELIGSGGLSKLKGFFGLWMVKKMQLFIVFRSSLRQVTYCRR